jgi:hypothetical protein
MYHHLALQLTQRRQKIKSKKNKPRTKKQAISAV